MELGEAIKKRRSTKIFSDSNLDWRKIIRAIDAARYAPSAGNQFVMKFILVKDKDKISEIGIATQQDFVGKAHYLVVAVSDDLKLIRSYGERASRYSAQQAGAAIENFLLALTAQGMVTSWVGHFYDEQVKRTLKIPDELQVEAIFPIGLPSKKNREPEVKKVDLDNYLFFDEWKNKKMEPETRVKVESA